MKGATMYEYQFFFNRIYLRFLRPRFCNRRSWPWIRLTICDKDGNIPTTQETSMNYNVYREDIPHPIPFWNKGKRFVLAYCREAFKKTGLRHIMRRVK